MKKLFLLIILLYITLFSYANGIDVPLPPAPNVVVGDVEAYVKKSCFGLNDGKIEIKINNFESGNLYDIYWYKKSTSTGELKAMPDWPKTAIPYSQNAADITGLEPGLYFLTIVSVNVPSTPCPTGKCGKVEMEIEVEQSEKLIIPEPTIIPNCTKAGSINFANGNIGNEAPYTYSWSNGTATLNQENLLAGIYMLTVTNANGCTVNKQYSIIAGLIKGDYGKLKYPCFKSNNGSIQVPAGNLWGGTPPYSFKWSNGETSNNLNGLEGGNYTVTISDQNMCTVEKSYYLFDIDYTINEPIITNLQCENKGSIIFDKGLVGPLFSTWNINFKWSTNNLWLNIQNNSPNLPNLLPGIYTISAQYRNCETSRSYEVKNIQFTYQYNQPYITKSCNESPTGSIYFSSDIVQNGNVPYTYKWSNGATTKNIDQLKNGTYEVSITDALGCTYYKSYTVIDEKIKLFELKEIVQAKCGQGESSFGSISLGNFKSGTNFKWSGTSNSTESSITNLSPGFYSVTAEYQGCKQSMNFSIFCCTSSNTIFLNTTVTDATNANAKNGSIITSGGGNYNYNWKGTNNFSSSDYSIKNLSAGIYYLTLNDGCSTIFRKYIVKNAEECLITKIEIGDALACILKSEKPESEVLNPKISGSTGYTYLWSTGENTPKIDVNKPGFYTLTVYDKNFCESTKVFTINEFDNVLVNADIDPVYTWTDCSLNNAQISIKVKDLKKYKVQWDEDPISSMKGLLWDWKFYPELPITSKIKIINECGIEKRIQHKARCTDENGQPCKVDIEFTKGKDCWEECSLLEPWFLNDCATITAKSNEDNITVIWPNTSRNYVLNKDEDQTYKPLTPDLYYILAFDESGCHSSTLFDYSKICEPTEWTGTGLGDNPIDVNCPHLIKGKAEVEDETNVILNLKYDYIPAEDLLIKIEVFDNNTGQLLKSYNRIGFKDEPIEVTLENVLSKFESYDITVNVSYPDYPGCDGFSKTLKKDVSCPDQITIQELEVENTCTVEVNAETGIDEVKIILYKIVNNKLQKIEEKKDNLSSGLNTFVFDVSNQDPETAFKIELIKDNCGKNEVRFNKKRNCPTSFKIDPNGFSGQTNLKITMFQDAKAKLTFLQNGNEKYAKTFDLKKGENSIPFTPDITNGTYNVQLEFINSSCPTLLFVVIKANFKNPDDDCRNQSIAIIPDVQSGSYFNFESEYSSGITILDGYIFSPQTLDSLSNHTIYNIPGSVTKAFIDSNKNLNVIKEVSSNLYIENYNHFGSLLWTSPLPNDSYQSTFPPTDQGTAILVKSNLDQKHYKVSFDNNGNQLSRTEWGIGVTDLLADDVKVFVHSESSFSTAVTTTDKTIVKNFENGAVKRQEFGKSFNVKNIDVSGLGYAIIGQAKNIMTAGNKQYYSKPYTSPIVVKTSRSNAIEDVAINDNGTETRLDASALDGTGNAILGVTTFNEPDAGTDSCSFLTILPLSTCGCTIDSSMLQYDAQQCKLSWTAQCPSYTYTLQKKVNNVWTTVSTSASPYNVSNGGDGSYRLSLVKLGCGTIQSAVVTTSCSTTCTCTAPTLILNEANCSITWDGNTCAGYAMTLQRLDGSTWANMAIQSPYYVSNINNGTYRLELKKQGCASVHSNTVAPTCGTACNCYAPLLTYDAGTCKLTWEAAACNGFTTKLQKFTNGIWTVISNAVSPYKLLYGVGGEYRLEIEKATCQSYYSNTIAETCYTDPCECNLAVLDFDASTCDLTWEENLCSDFDYHLQIKVGYVWQDVANAASPYNIPTGQSSTYRLALTSNTCNDLYSDEVIPVCNPCNCAEVTLTYNSQNCNLTWDTGECQSYLFVLQQKDGSQWLDINGANSPYTIPSNVTNTYRLKAVSSNCTIIYSNELTQSCINCNALSLDYSGIQTNSCQNIILNSTGGTAPYIYSWNPTGNLSSTQINNSNNIIPSKDEIIGAAGSYLVTVTDALGCNSNVSISYDRCDCICKKETSFCTSLLTYTNSGGTSTYVSELLPANKYYKISFYNQSQADQFKMNYISNGNTNEVVSTPYFGVSNSNNCSAFVNTSAIPAQTNVNQIISQNGGFTNGVNVLQTSPTAWDFTFLTTAIGKIEVIVNEQGCFNGNNSFSIACVSQSSEPFNTNENESKDKEIVLSNRKSDQSIPIYPNPFTNGFTIDIKAPSSNFTKLLVTNSSGQQIFKDLLPLGEGDNRYYLIDSESWPTGIFHISLIAEDGSIVNTSKVIKVK